MTRAFDAAHRTHRAQRQTVVVTEKGSAEVPQVSHVMGGAAADSASEAPLQEMKGRTVTVVMSLSFGMGGDFEGEKYLQ